MKRRQFVKLATMGVAGTICPLVNCTEGSSGSLSPDSGGDSHHPHDLSGEFPDRGLFDDAPFFGDHSVDAGVDKNVDQALPNGDSSSDTELSPDSVSDAGSSVDLQQQNDSWTPGGDFTHAKTSPLPGTNDLPAPAYLATIIDPHYGGKITRVTNTGVDTEIIGIAGRRWNDRSVFRTHYPSVTQWSADAKLLKLAKGGIFLDVANGYACIECSEPPSTGPTYFSPADADLMFGASGNAIQLINVRTGAVEQSLSAAGYTDFSFQVRTSPSYDGRKIACRAIRSSDGHTVALGFDVTSGVLEIVVDFEDPMHDNNASHPGFGQKTVSDDKWARASATPSGKYLFLNGQNKSTDGYNDQALFFDWHTGALVWDQPDNNSVEAPGGHGDMAMHPDGRELFVGVCKGGGTAPEVKPFEGHHVGVIIEAGQYLALGPISSHVGARCSMRPGWSYGSGWGVDATIKAYRNDGNRIEYLGNPQNLGGSYDEETQANVSPDGTKIAFTSNWRNLFTSPQCLVLDVGDLV